MRNIGKTVAVSALAALALCSCKSTDISQSSQVLARVGDKEITSAYFERQLAELPPSVRELSSQGEGKRAALEGLVNRELIYDQAIKKHLDKDADLSKKLEDLKKELIIKTYLQNQLAGKVDADDREVQAYYNSNPQEYRHREEVRVSQIVVPTQEKAAEVIEKLSIKREFGDLASTYSTDKGSAERNGDVGWFTAGKLPAEVRDGVFRLGVGEVSKAYKMGDSYEIYKVTDRRTTSYDLEQVKELIRAQLINEKTQKEVKTLVDGLKKTTVVQLNEKLLR